MLENKVVIYQEGLFGNVLSLFSFGLIAGSKVDPVNFTNLLNIHAKEGWEVVAVTRESRRSFLIFRREAFVVILKRQKNV